MKTNCDPFLLEISDHLDTGEALSGKTQSHLNQCDECAEFLHAWSPDGSLNKAAAHSIQLEPTQTMADEIIAKLPSSTKQPNIILRFAPALSIAAALAVGFFTLNQFSSPQIPTETTQTTTTPSPNTDEKVPEIFHEIEQYKIKETIADYGISSVNVINNSSRNIHKITSKLEYLSTNLSKIITLPTFNRDADTYIQSPSNQA